jgi:hypothetical protein
MTDRERAPKRKAEPQPDEGDARHNLIVHELRIIKCLVSEAVHEKEQEVSALKAQVRSLIRKNQRLSDKVDAQEYRLHAYEVPDLN